MSDYDNLLIKYQELQEGYRVKVEENEQYKGKSYILKKIKKNSWNNMRSNWKSCKNQVERMNHTKN